VDGIVVILVVVLAWRDTCSLCPTKERQVSCKQVPRTEKEECHQQRPTYIYSRCYSHRSTTSNVAVEGIVEFALVAFKIFIYKSERLRSAALSLPDVSKPPTNTMADYYNAPEEDYDRLNRQVVTFPSPLLLSSILIMIGI
jgi:hypothetical protein